MITLQFSRWTPSIVKITAVYGAIAILGWMLFSVLHHLGNQIPYELAQQRFAASFPETVRDDIPVTGINYTPEFNTKWEYCELSAMVLAGSAIKRSPIEDAVLLKGFGNVSALEDFCPELKALSEGADLTDELAQGQFVLLLGKFRYAWGSKAIYAIALNYFSVSEIHLYIKIGIYIAHVVLAIALFFLHWKYLLISAPLILSSLFFSGMEYFSDIANGIPYVWTVLSSAGMTFMIQQQTGRRYIPLFCFFVGLVSYYFWLFDGHNFLLLVLIGMIAWFGYERLNTRTPFLKSIGCMAIYGSGFVSCFVLTMLSKSVVYEVFSPGIGEKVSYDPDRFWLNMLHHSVYRIADRAAFPQDRDMMGKDIESYWKLLSMSHDMQIFFLTTSALSLVVTLSIIGFGACSLFSGYSRPLPPKSSWSVLWTFGLILGTCIHFVMPNDVAYRAVRFMFIPLSLCWSCLFYILMENRRLSFISASVVAMGTALILLYYLYISRPSVVEFTNHTTLVNSHTVGSPADIYYTKNSLIYLIKSCEQYDVIFPFFLHIDPVDKMALPTSRRQFGFDNLDFDFRTHAQRVREGCLAQVTLPDYSIARVRTGQYVPSQDPLWSVEFSPAD